MTRRGRLLTARRFCLTILVFVVILIVVMTAAPFVGPTKIDVVAGLRGQGTPADRDIFLFQRLPRVVLSALAGAALALVGVTFQALLRNPLATPYTMGVAGGGALGAAIAWIVPGLTIEWGPISTVQLFALAGALVNISVVYMLARARGHFTTTGILLAGVTLGLLSSALILFVRYLASPHLLVAMDRWIMGGVDVQGYGKIASLLPMLLPGVAVLLSLGREFNQLAFGEELAAGRGVDVTQVKLTAFVAGSLVTAAAVSVVGPIGFVGLLVPHTMRRIVGPDHRLLLPVSFLAGGAFLILADTVARTINPPAELPVGVLTAMLGGPFFLIILVRSRRVDDVG